MVACAVVASAYQVNVISQNHSIINHEVVVELDATVDSNDTIKDYVLSLTVDKGAPKNIKVEDITNVAPAIPEEKTLECLTSKADDKNGELTCIEYGYVVTKAAKPEVKPVNLVKTITKNIDKTDISWNQVTVSRATKKRVKISWQTPINSGGTWSFNPSGDWNSEWLYWRGITITNTQSFAKLDTNAIYSVSGLDTSTLISQGKMQADCGDLRVIFNDANEITPINVFSCNDTNTIVSFPLFNTILGGATDTNYSFYYGNSSAANFSDLWGDWNSSSHRYEFAHYGFDGGSCAPFTASLLNVSCSTGVMYPVNAGAWNAAYASWNGSVANKRWDWIGKVTSGADSDFHFAFSATNNRADQGGGTYIEYLIDELSTNPDLVTNSGTVINGTAVKDSNPHWLSTTRNADGNWEIFYDFASLGSATENTIDTNTYMVFVLYNDTNATRPYVDDLTISSFTGSTSNYSIGAEQSASSVDFNGYVTYSGNNYTKNIGYTLTYNCSTGQTGTGYFRVNGTNNTAHTLTCDDSTHNAYGTYNPLTNGTRWLDVNYVLQSPYSDTNTGATTFIFDYDAPTIVSSDSNSESSTTIGGTLQCSDGISPVNDYNMFSNSVQIATAQDANNTIQYWSNLTLSGGANTISFKCTDLAGNTSTATDSTYYLMTIKIPLDEAQPSLQIIPFNVIFNGNPQSNQSDLNSDTNFLVNYSSPTFSVVIDANSDFFYPRTYSFNTSDTNLVLQPYLLDKNASTAITVYTVNNAKDRASLSNVQLKLYANVAGVDTLVEHVYSDATGVATLHMQNNTQYTLYAYYNGVLKGSGPIIPSSTTMFVFVETGTFSPTPIVGGVFVNYDVNGNVYIPRADGNITLSQEVLLAATTLGSVNILATQNGNTITSLDYDYSGVASDFNLSYDVNTGGLNPYQLITITLTIVDANGSTLYSGSGTYTFVSSTSYSDIIQNAKNGLGYLASTMFFVLVSIWAIGLITTRRVGEDNNSLYIVALFITGIGVLITLIPFTQWVIAAFFGGLVYVWRQRDYS